MNIIEDYEYDDMNYIIYIMNIYMMNYIILYIWFCNANYLE